MHAPLARRRPRTLALELVDSLGNRIRAGQLQAGDKLPTEAAIMEEFEVSRTVVREAISKLQAAGLVETRHGIGTFVLGPGDGPSFKITPEQFSTLQDVIAVLELRIGLETEAAGLAAQRRTADNLAVMRRALDAVIAAVEAGEDSVGPDFQFHLEVARATQNSHFTELFSTLGAQIIPRARLEPGAGMDQERLAYMRRVNAEHESIFDAISGQDADAARAAMRTHLSNSRERRRRAQAQTA
ncbi:FadR/GntR family transcriptional regulator [Roseateles saccharophilus]|uniref:DNA-binding FadR family transcriptional regulator n=1 Tax=Roseateles saccharophilus TaxID=304 RepID=A0A4R3UX57_ROSSA|nr:FadR/GntR family transcriptional regulator [Roseateles saccharophilus]MDG0832683.1 FadR family transcriptional regulator [Roseateles saccharophilus]TCU95383.1 DNA-binding FadR family transcriptional regulator [Roseateles saccharophilus]